MCPIDFQVQQIIQRCILIALLAFCLCSVACSSLSIVVLIENSVMSRWVPPHHFPCAVGGRVYFRLSGVYVNAKGRDCLQTADCAHWVSAWM